MPPLRVAVVEDDPNFLQAFTQALATTEDMTLAWAAGTVAEALAWIAGGAEKAAGPSAVQVLVADLGLPDGSGIQVIEAASLAWPDCAIMVSTTFADEAHVLRAIEAGASGYLLKDSTPAGMTEEIRSLHGGGSPISPIIARQLLTRLRPAPAPATNNTASSARPLPATEIPTLSEREKQTLELIAKGFTYEEIAQVMGISRFTVMTFVRRIYGKLKVRSKTEAIYEARNYGLLSDF